MINCVAIIAKPDNKSIKPIMVLLAELLTKRKVETLYEKKAADIMGVLHSSHEEIRQNAKMIIVLGGDGTMLSASRIVGDTEIPILGVHMGRLGFITEIYPEEAIYAVSAALDGQLSIYQRMQLECDIVRDDVVVERGRALNEVTLSKGVLARMIEFDLFIGKNLVNRYRADGFIIATPTGSTGYSLSAGGPIAHPGLELFLLTPICAHSLNSRTLIVSADNIVEIKLIENRKDIYVSRDGQVGRHLWENESLRIRKSSVGLNFFAMPDRDFYKHLRIKFNWSGV